MNVVLVVAEDRGIREALTAALQDTCLVLVEPGIEEALRRLISVHADAVILDDTPSLGVGAVRRFRQVAPQIPILALASRSDPETRADFVLAGARASLSKPFSCEDLIGLLNEVFSLQAEPAPLEPTPADPVAASPALTQYQTCMRWLNRAMNELDDPKRLDQILADALVDVFDPVRSAVLRERDGAVYVAASQGISASVTRSLRLDFSSGLLRWFEENSCLIDRHAGRVSSAASKEMHLLGARLGVPLMCGGHVVGALLVGEKGSGREYSSEERELLALFGRGASTALENAALHRSVAQQQGHLKAVMSNITSGVVVIDRSRNIAMMNESAERILQIRAGEILGRSVQKLGSGFADIVLRVLAEKKPLLRQEVRDPAIDATLGLSAAPVADDGVVVVFSRLPQGQTQTEDVAYSPYWEFLSARVAQEIKNPLVAINTFAQLLPRKYDSDEFRAQFAEVVQKEVGRINRVVETLFDFARHPRLVMQNVNLNETIGQVLDTFTDKARERNVSIIREMDPSFPRLELDPLYFSQALCNVVQNALDSLVSGGTVRVTSQKKDDWYEIVVTDTGGGVADQAAPLVFLPFFGTREQGMGLGLTVASRIMKQHHGDLKMLTGHPGGAFALLLPARTRVNVDHAAGAKLASGHLTSGFANEDYSRHG